ncbi:MAG: cupredoxin family copper-binding protein [Candidatus Eremiobacteraeota bacterium]|nr:cupredoxin family copper-binding protein [Candidatus Eremiobacteraeota bacterium]
MRTFVLSLLAALALGSVAVAQSPAPSTAPAPAASPAPTTSAAVKSVVVVHIKNFAFVPDTVTIEPGQTVRWVQDDDTPHTVTASNKSFDSGNLNKKDAWTYAFAKPGTYAYVCAYHPYMKGKVIVKAP